MRVAYVCADPGVPVYGRKGASVHVQEVIRALGAHGADVELFAASIGGEPPPGLEEVPVHRLPAVGGADPARRERRALAANADLSRALDEAGPFDLLYERYALWSFAGMSYASERGVPGVLEVNAPLIEEQARHRVLVDRRGAEQVARRLFERATAVVAVSAAVAEWVRARSRRPGGVHVVPNGVDPGRFSVDAGRSRDAAMFTVGFVGSLKPWHGVDALVRAVALLARREDQSAERGWRLLVVGDGPQRDALTALVDACGLAHATTFTGAVDPGRIPALLGGMDVAAAPYSDAADDYFSPLKLYEYLAAGVPVVASDVGQAGETLREADTGVLTAPGDVVALAAALDWLRRDPESRRAFAAAGRDWVLRERTWTAVAGRILELAEAVAPPRTPTAGVG